MSDHQQEWQDIFNQFACDGVVASVTPFGSGHINDTFLVVTEGDDHPNYTFRCVNTYVFRDIDGLMNNIALVTKHLSDKLQSIDNSCTTHTMHLVHTQSGQPFFRDDQEHVWTCYEFVPGKTHEHYQDVKLAHEAGAAFGQFIALLQDMDPNQLCASIPNFHDIDLRLEQWHAARAKASAEDLAACAQWIDFVEARQDAMHFLKSLVQQGKLPLRITHNDTKCNNILFDDQNQAVCVIDLDTVMPGLIHFDFSDAVRTATTSHEEDEKDIDRVKINMEALKQFCHGFITQIKSFATDEELATLAPSVTYISYLLGLRFFTDHLSGDVYFKTQYRGHNMVRARNQFRFVEILEEQQELIHQLIDDICKQTVECD